MVKKIMIKLAKQSKSEVLNYIFSRMSRSRSQWKSYSNPQDISKILKRKSMLKCRSTLDVQSYDFEILPNDKVCLHL